MVIYHFLVCLDDDILTPTASLRVGRLIFLVLSAAPFWTFANPLLLSFKRWSKVFSFYDWPSATSLTLGQVNYCWPVFLAVQARWLRGSQLGVSYIITRAHATQFALTPICNVGGGGSFFSFYLVLTWMDQTVCQVVEAAADVILWMENCINVFHDQYRIANSDDFRARRRSALARTPIEFLCNA